MIIEPDLQHNTGHGISTSVPALSQIILLALKHFFLNDIWSYRLQVMGFAISLYQLF